MTEDRSVPPTAKTAAAAVVLLGDHAVGRVVAALDVHGVNTLKSVAPAPATISGQTVRAVGVDDGLIVLDFDHTRAVIDLQRVGVVRFIADLPAWRPGSGPQPTVRLRLADGSGLDFTEPSKTKRITLRLSDR